MHSIKAIISFISAIPRDQEYLSVKEEYEAIEEVLLSSEKYRVTHSYDLSKTEFKKVIKDSHIDILHYSGHSNESGVLFTDKKDGNHELMKVNSFKNCLENSNNISFLILNSCHSESIAKKLKLKVKIILSFKDLLVDKEAINFSKIFYQHINESELDLRNPNLSKLYEFIKQTLIEINTSKEAYLFFGGKSFPLQFPHIKFNILKNYSKILIDINKKNKELLNSDICVYNGQLINNTIETLKQSGIIFIVSPLLTGKSIFINQIEEKTKNDKIHFQLIDPIYIRNRHRSDLNDLLDFYSLIAHYILRNAYKYYEADKTESNYHIFDKIDYFIYQKGEITNELLKLYENNTKNYLLWMVDWVDSLLHPLIDDFAVLSIPLEEFHHLKDELIENFRTDILNINKRLTHTKIKLLVTSRYIPCAWISSLTINLVPFNVHDILSIISTNISLELPNKKDQKELAKIIHGFTNGHPWYVINSIIQYFIARGSGITNNPVELIYSIYSQQNLWIYNGDSFNVMMQKLIELWKDTNNAEKEETLQHINFQLKNRFTTKSIHHSQNSFMQQSGLFEYIENSNRKDVRGFYNFIVQNFVINELREIVKSY